MDTFKGTIVPNYRWRWDFIIDMVREHNFNDIMELGVWRGENAKHILEKIYPRHFWLVDNGYYPELMKWLDDTKKMVNVHYLKLESKLMAHFFKDEILDMIFIDANHSYESVKLDIELWTSKVKKGGVISGHDYNHHHGTGVKQAVDEAFGDKVFIQKEENGEEGPWLWWVYK